MAADLRSRQFGAQIEPHLDRLYRAAFRLTGDRSDAEDLVQETCLRAFVKLKDFSAAHSPDCWLMRVQYHLFVDRARHQKRSRTSTIEWDDEAGWPAEDDQNPEITACQAQREAQLLRGLAKLNEDQRALLALRVEGYSLAEMEAITGLGVEVLNARLHRARQSLARHMRHKDEAVEPVQMEGRR